MTLDDDLTTMLRTHEGPLAPRAHAARRRSPRRRLGAVVVGGLAVLGTAAAVASTTLDNGRPSIRDAVLTVDLPADQRANCALIGGRADRAQAAFTAQGRTVEWRLTTYGGVDPTAVGSERAFKADTDTPRTVPDDSVVEDIQPDPRSPTVLIFVHAPGGPAPQVAPAC